MADHPHNIESIKEWHMDKKPFEESLRNAKQQIEIIDAKIEEELARVKETINVLQEQKKAVRLMYDGAAKFLNVENEFEKEEKE